MKLHELEQKKKVQIHNCTLLLHCSRLEVVFIGDMTVPENRSK